MKAGSEQLSDAAAALDKPLGVGKRLLGLPWELRDALSGILYELWFLLSSQVCVLTLSNLERRLVSYFYGIAPTTSILLCLFNYLRSLLSLCKLAK